MSWSSSSDRKQINPIDDLITKIKKDNQMAKHKIYHHSDSSQNEPSAPNCETDTDVDNFIKYINKSIKWTNTPGEPELVEQNNQFLYFLARSGIRYMNKIDH